MENKIPDEPTSNPSKKKSSRRVERYLLYAIGEILLVMIGILLALEANNWNEERIFQKEIFDSMNALKEEMKTNEAILDDCLQDVMRRRKSLDLIRLNALNSFQNLSRDSLNYLFIWAAGNITRCDPNSDVLKDLQSSGGIRRLENNQLRLSISRWTSEYNEYMREESSWDGALINNILPATFNRVAWNDIDRLFQDNRHDQRYPPSNFDVDPRKMTQSLEFENTLNMQYWFIFKVESSLMELKNRTQHVQRLIEDLYSS